MGSLLRCIVLAVGLSLGLATAATAQQGWATGAYGNNVDMSRTFDLPGATNLVVRVNGETEKSYDFLYLYDQYGTQVAALNGVINYVGNVAGSRLRVRLVSDYSVTKGGVTVSVEGIYTQTGTTAATNASGGIFVLPRKPQVTDVATLMQLKGWDYAAGLMNYWFASSGRNYIIENLDTALAISPEAQAAFNEWRNAGNILNFTQPTWWGGTQNSGETYKNELVKALGKARRNGASVLLTGGSFDFISTEIALAGEGWREASTEAAGMNYIGERTFGSDGLTASLDQSTAAFGAATLRLLAKGSVSVDAYTQVATIVVDGWGVYLRDSYDFTTTNQPLGCWGFDSPYVSKFAVSLSWNCLGNSDFRTYQAQYGRGADFRIFSRPKTFAPTGVVSFRYQLTAADTQNYGGGGNVPASLITRLATTYSGYFGTAQSTPYLCYESYTCQDFSNGRKAAVHNTALVLYCNGGGPWYYYGPMQ